MKKNLRKIVSLVLVLAMTLAISVPAFAMERTEPTAMNSNLSENNVKEISTQIREISREEFLKNFAKQKGISIDEADKIDKAQTQSDYQQELAKHKTSSQRLTSSVSPLDASETVYKQITKTYNTGSSGSFWSQIVVVIQVKLQRYNSSSYGTYQKFTQVLSVGSDCFGSGACTWNTIAQSADITGDSGYGNKLVMMLSGNVVIAVSTSLQAGANSAGFSISYSVGNTNYFRKLIQINETFSSNYDLS